MKNFKEFVNESIRPKQTIFYFPNATIFGLYMFEMEGQISDGKYENDKTKYDKWINTLSIKQGEPAYKSYFNLMKFDISDIYKEFKNTWGIRIYYYAKYSNVLNDFDLYNKVYSEGDDSYIRKLIENISKIIEDDKSYEDALKYFNEFSKKYNNISYLDKIFNEDIYNKYKNSKYSENDLMKDLETLSETFKNKIPY